MLLIQEKLDGIKTRYSDITATSSKALRTLEQARQLATKFQSTHEELNSWMSKVEEELASSGGQSPAGEQIPQFQQRQKVGSSDRMQGTGTRGLCGRRAGEVCSVPGQGAWGRRSGSVLGGDGSKGTHCSLLQSWWLLSLCGEAALLLCLLGTHTSGEQPRSCTCWL